MAVSINQSFCHTFRPTAILSESSEHQRAFCRKTDEAENPAHRCPMQAFAYIYTLVSRKGELSGKDFVMWGYKHWLTWTRGNTALSSEFDQASSPKPCKQYLCSRSTRMLPTYFYGLHRDKQLYSGYKTTSSKELSDETVRAMAGNFN
jgi:hypothetical protein